MRIILPLMITISILISGCSGWLESCNKGGSGLVKFGNKITEILPDGKTVTTEKIVEVNTNQPDNPNSNANVTAKFDNKGNIIVSTNTGSSHNTTRDIAAFKSTVPLMWAGIGIGLVGAIILLAGKLRLKYMIWGIGFILYGGALSVLSIVLPSNIMLFTILLISGAVLLVGFIGYMVYRQFKVDTANEENVSVIEMLKRKFMTKEDIDREFKQPGGIVYEAQSTSTKKEVNKIRKEIEHD